MYARIQTQGKELTFKVVPIKADTFTVVDSEGYTCGVFGSESSAKKAISGIRNNVKHAKVILKASWYRPPYFNKNKSFSKKT